jgi:hypothetical protein
MPVTFVGNLFLSLTVTTFTAGAAVCWRVGGIVLQSCLPPEEE